jgi:hypothetical protein
MVETAIIADEIRKHIEEGMITDTAWIAIVAHLADLFPDMTIAQLSAAVREAIADGDNRKRPQDADVTSKPK